MWLTREQAQADRRARPRRSPREACGIIAGQRRARAEIIPIPNSAAQPCTPTSWTSAPSSKR